MPDQYAAVKRTLGELLSTTSANIKASEFQREYSWESQHVEQFWLDLRSFSERCSGERWFRETGQWG